MMRIVALFATVGAVATEVLHFACPAAAAAGCPTCYGFTDLGDGVYVDGKMPADRRAEAKITVEAARDRVRAFYGDLQSNPRVLICATDAGLSEPGPKISIAGAEPSRPAWKARREMLPAWTFALRVRAYR